MPTDNFAGIDLDLIYPPFAERMLQVVADLNDQGHIYKITSGRRAFSVQAELHRKYLERMSLEAEDAAGHITDLGKLQLQKYRIDGNGGRAAAAGFSNHNYGIAMDCAAVVNGKLAWTPNPELLFKPWNDTLLKYGLGSGFPYQDYDHAEIAGIRSASQLRPLLDIWQRTNADETTNLKAVWTWLDSNVVF